MKKILVIAIVLSLGITALPGCSELSSESKNETMTGTVQSETSVEDKESQNEQQDSSQNNSAPEESSKAADEGTYEHNAYYDIVETASYTDSIGYTHVIHKVLAKDDVRIDASVIAYGKDDSVIGKSTDTITLTKGKYNYFSYSFEKDITNARLDATTKAKADSLLTSERNGVEMVKYDIQEHNLYITLKQVTDELGSFAKFKLLYYKGDKIVGCDDGYFNIYAQNLNGKDSTDVAELLTYGNEFDKVEYIYEP